MNRVITFEELKAKLGAASEGTQRRLYFTALLAREAELPTDEFFVVGGSAIEFYTVGEYTSGDIDVVSSRHDRLREVLKLWGFHRDGRVWLNEELGCVVDILSLPYRGEVARTTVVSTPYGLVRLAAIEDLLVKRLASTKFWDIEGDFDHAKLLAVQFADRMDWAYVQHLAKEYDVVDLLAILTDLVGAQGKRARTTE